jgi:hypothetical protein
MESSLHPELPEGSSFQDEVPDQRVEEERLPPGWIMHIDPTYNCPYYYNHISNISQWERPVPNRSRSHTSSFSSTQIPVSSPAELPKELQVIQQKYLRKTQKTYTNARTKHKPSIHVDYSDIDASEDESFTKSIPDQEASHQLYSDMDDDEDTASTNLPKSRDTRSNSFEKINRSKPIRDRETRAHDYDHFAKLYRMHRKYHDPHCIELCVLCHRNQVSHALFPCDHRCVCSDCILTYDICEYTIMMAESFPNCHYNCPLCAGLIKKIFPMEGGKEIDKYWDWCYEVVPPLPNGFEKKFTLSAEVIQKVFIDDVHESSDGSKTCVLS